MASQRVVDEGVLGELILNQSIKRDQDKSIQLMLISDKEEMKKLHYYIFASASDVDYYTVENLSSEDISIIYDMDIIIYNKRDDELKEIILQVIEAQKLDLKFFEISNREYLRQKDLLIAHNSGIDKLFEKEFMIEEFVMNIEMFLKTNFYTKRLLSLKESEDVMIDSRGLFESRVQELLEKKIFFSLIKYEFDSDGDISSYNLKKIVREHDTIYYDNEKKRLHFLILNTVPSFGKKIINKRMRDFSIYIENIDALSSFELVYEEK